MVKPGVYVEVVVLLEVSLQKRPVGQDVSPIQAALPRRGVYAARKPRARVYFFCVARRAARFGAGASPESAPV